MPSDKIIYGDGFKEVKVIEGAVDYTQTNTTLKTNVSTNPMDLADMAQSSYFTIMIDKLDPSLNKGTGFTNGVFKNFLPVENISYTPVSLEMLSITAGIFGDLSICNRRKLGRFTIRMTDTATETYGTLLSKWYNLTAPTNGFTGYLEDTVGIMNYKTYRTTGEVNKEANLLVMLSDAITVGHSYSENALKMIDFNVVVVGTGTVKNKNVFG